MRKTFEECQDLFMRARATRNMNDMAVWATELLTYDETLPWVWASRGEALAGLGHHIDAILNYDRALELQQDDDQKAILYSNKGAAYWDMFNAAKAKIWLNKALDLNPMAQTYLTLGNIHKFEGRLTQAINSYRLAVRAMPDYADGHLMLGMALLKAGFLQEGWKEYEWRWKTEQLPARQLKCPQWNGEDLSGKTILVYGEQGLGDIIQFARYADILQNHFPTAKIIVEGRPALKRLLNTLKGAYAVINVGERLPALDYAIPMLTLAGFFTPTIGSIPSYSGYRLDINDVDLWAEKFKQLPTGTKKIGICWSGMARTSHPSALAVDQLRSTTFDTFAPLGDIPNITWVSLQKGPQAEQTKTPPRGFTIADFTEDMYDFYETACAAKNCDLVITVDTAVAHACGSVGVPTWVLSRWDGCWRWFGDRSDSPWYPSITQFEQPAPHDWAGLMNKVAKELRTRLDSNKPL